MVLIPGAMLFELWNDACLVLWLFFWRAPCGGIAKHVWIDPTNYHNPLSAKHNYIWFISRFISVIGMKWVVKRQDLQYTFPNSNTPHSDWKLNYLVGSPVPLFSITTRHTVIKTELFSWELCLCAKSCKQCFGWSQIKQMWVIFRPLEVVGRGSTTQLQVGWI